MIMSSHKRKHNGSTAEEQPKKRIHLLPAEQTLSLSERVNSSATAMKPTSSVSTANRDVFPFFKLPGETRNKIYNYAPMRLEHSWSSFDGFNVVGLAKELPPFSGASTETNNAACQQADASSPNTDAYPEFSGLLLACKQIHQEYTSIAPTRPGRVALVGTELSSYLYWLPELQHKEVIAASTEEVVVYVHGQMVYKYGQPRSYYFRILELLQCCKQTGSKIRFQGQNTASDSFLARDLNHLPRWESEGPAVNPAVSGIKVGYDDCSGLQVYVELDFNRF